jgi:two-component system OmpR family response regulator
MAEFDVGRRILVVDDDKSVLELVTTRLTLAGYNTFNARNGHEALSRLKNLRPAALVLDLNMPSLDGFGVLERMGKEMTASIPTLVLTASRGPADVQRAIALGARDYLAKPFTAGSLLMRVSRLFRRPIENRSLNDMITSVEQMLE